MVVIVSYTVCLPTLRVSQTGLTSGAAIRKLRDSEGLVGQILGYVVTIIVFYGIAWVVMNSPQWPAVREQFFSFEHMKKVFPNVLRGFWLDMWLFVVAQLVIILVSIGVALIRSMRGPLFKPFRIIAILYVDIFRGIPLVLAVLLFGFGVPALEIPGLPHSELFWGTTTLVLSYGAYTSEVVRSGIESVPESQRLAARSLGLTQFQALRYAILPQALRNVMPALLNGVVSLQKDVALISVLGVRDAVREASIYSSRSFNYSGYFLAALLFLAVSVPLARYADYWAKKSRILHEGTMG